MPFPRGGGAASSSSPQQLAVGQGLVTGLFSNVTPWVFTYTTLGLGSLLLLSVGNFSSATISTVAVAGTGSPAGNASLSIGGAAAQSPIQNTMVYGSVTGVGGIQVTINMSAAASGIVALQEFQPFFGVLSADGSPVTANTTTSPLTIPKQTPSGSFGMCAMTCYDNNGVPSLPVGWVKGPTGATSIFMAWVLNTSAPQQAIVTDAGLTLACGVGQNFKLT